MKELQTNATRDMETEIVEAISMFQPRPTIAIIGHESPDGDCVGACAAMEIYVQNLKEHFFPEPEFVIDVIIESIYKNVENVLPKVCERTPQHNDDYDIAIALDVNKGRMGEKGNKAFENAKMRLMIDHHATNDGEGADKYWIRPGFSSCCELLYWLIAKDTQLDFPSICAKELYVGFLTDTGGFRFDSTTPDTLIAASKLIACGIDFPEINRKLFSEKEYIAMKVTSQAVLNAELRENKIIVSVITHEELQKLGANANHTGRVPNELLSCEDAIVSIAFTEYAPGEYTGSFRSKSKDVDVSACAIALGGGGHRAAAGCKFTTNDIEEVVKMSIAILSQK